jgi:hypothetical protein
MEARTQHWEASGHAVRNTNVRISSTLHTELHWVLLWRCMLQRETPYSKGLFHWVSAEVLTSEPALRFVAKSREYSRRKPSQMRTIHQMRHSRGNRMSPGHLLSPFDGTVFGRCTDVH